MSMRHAFGGPPHGVPISEELHEQFPDDVKVAWQTFDTWWKQAKANLDGDCVSASSMPADVEAAMDLICKTPIPGYENATGADSCYMIGVQGQMVD